MKSFIYGFLACIPCSFAVYLARAMIARWFVSDLKKVEQKLNPPSGTPPTA